MTLPRMRLRKTNYMQGSCALSPSDPQKSQKTIEKPC